MEKVKRSVVARSLGGRGGINRRAQRIFRAVKKNLKDTIMMNTCYYTFVETQRTYP